MRSRGEANQLHETGRYSITRPAIGARCQDRTPDEVAHLKTITSLSLLLALSSWGQDKSDLTVDQIVQRHVDALGGIEKMHAIHTFSATGKASMMGGQIQAAMLMKMKRPSSMRIDMTIQNRQMVQAFDGSTAWVLNSAAGPTKATPEETREMRNSADIDFSSLVDYREKGSTVELAGTDDVDGHASYRLKVTRQNGRVEYDFLDAKTFLPVKTATRRKQMGTEVDIEAYPSNFRPVNGVLFPFQVDQKAGGKLVVQLTIEKVEVNIPLEDAVFRMPELSSDAAIPGKKF